MLTAHMTRSAILLTLFSVMGTGLVALTHALTKDRIAEAERAALLRSLHQIISEEQYDNDLFNDYIEVNEPEMLGSKEPVSIYRARQQGEPLAALITSAAPDGYGGAIKLLVGIYYNGTLAGVRVIAHSETPGLGDAIEAKRSPWILQFSGLSLQTPSKEQWKVRRDGGVFDQFTGATITPRAVVKAISKTLIYYQQNREVIFQQATQAKHPVESDHEPD